MFCACQQIRVFKKNDGDTSVRELDYNSDSNMIFTGEYPEDAANFSANLQTDDQYK